MRAAEIVGVHGMEQSRATDRLGPQNDPYSASMTPAEEQFVAEAHNACTAPRELPGARG